MEVHVLWVRKSAQKLQIADICTLKARHVDCLEPFGAREARELLLPALCAGQWDLRKLDVRLDLHVNLAEVGDGEAWVVLYYAPCYKV